MRAVCLIALPYLVGAMFAVELDMVWDVQTLGWPLFVVLVLVLAALLLPSRRSA
jgi:hypothetical protein